MNTPVRWSALALVGLLALCAGCSHLGVKPWQRGYLARDSMLPDADPVENAMDDHLYFSKEASSGGRAFGGGGCGCN